MFLLSERVIMHKMTNTVPSFWRQKSVPLHFTIVTVGKVLALVLQYSLCLCPSVAVCDWQEMDEPPPALWRGLSRGCPERLCLSSCSLPHSTVNLNKTGWRIPFPCPLEAWRTNQTYLKSNLSLITWAKLTKTRISPSSTVIFSLWSADFTDP